MELEGISVESFKQSLEKLNIFDQRFAWRAIDHEGLVYLSGPARYIELVEQMAERLDRPPAEDNGDKIYMWTDSNGVMNYSSAPPKNASGETEVGAITIRRPNPRSWTPRHLNNNKVNLGTALWQLNATS